MKYLTDALPVHLWLEAESQADRSTLKNFRTGAVIFDKKTHEIYSKGCSHKPMGENSMDTTHAEHHALQNYYDRGQLSSVLIVCLGKTGNYAYSARPCYSCLNKLSDAAILNVYYAERCNDGSWICNIETPEQLLNRCDDSRRNYMRYAKEMRIG